MEIRGNFSARIPAFLQMLHTVSGILGTSAAYLWVAVTQMGKYCHNCTIQTIKIHDLRKILSNTLIFLELCGQIRYNYPNRYFGTVKHGNTENGEDAKFVQISTSEGESYLETVFGQRHS